MRSRWWIKSPRFKEHCGCEYYLIYRGNWTKKAFKRCEEHEKQKVEDNTDDSSTEDGS